MDDFGLSALDLLLTFEVFRKTTPSSFMTELAFSCKGRPKGHDDDGREFEDAESTSSEPPRLL